MTSHPLAETKFCPLADIVDKHIPLDEDQLHDLIAMYDTTVTIEGERYIVVCDFVEEIMGEFHRWNVPILTILKSNDRLFAIYWMRGLTECQEDMFDEQPYEVVCEQVMDIRNEYHRIRDDV